MATLPNPFALQRILCLQVCFLSLCAAYPYLLIPSTNSDVSKRSFDRLEQSAFGFQKRAFDRLSDGDFGLLKRSITKRAFDRLEMADFGFRRKRAFDRIARGDFGFRKKRSFDRLGGHDFGLMKREDPTPELSDDAREALVDDLTQSIVALNHMDEPVLVIEEQDN